MKALSILLLLATSIYAYEYGVSLAYPMGRKNCDQADFRLGMKLFPMDCSLTIDDPNYGSFYSVGSCDRFTFHQYACTTPELCENTKYCSIYANVSLGCE